MAAPSGFLSAFSPSGPQEYLWACLGLDHVQRGRLRCVGHFCNRRLHDKTPTFIVSDGVSIRKDSYSNFWERAKVRVADFRRDARAGLPPVNERGNGVFVAWDRSVGRPWPHPLEDGLEVLDGRVWISPDRAAPALTAYADARFWRGDQLISWGRAFPDSQRWPRVTYPRRIPGSYRAPGQFPERAPAPVMPEPVWVFGGMPAPLLAGLRGEPVRDLPPAPPQRGRGS